MPKEGVSFSIHGICAGSVASYESSSLLCGSIAFSAGCVSAAAHLQRLSPLSHTKTTENGRETQEMLVVAVEARTVAWDLISLVFVDTAVSKHLWRVVFLCSYAAWRSSMALTPSRVVGLPWLPVSVRPGWQRRGPRAKLGRDRFDRATLGSAGVVLGRVVLRAVRTVDTDGRGKILVTEKSYKQGEMLFVEEPVIEILQESPQPSMKDLKRWIDLFVQLPEEKQQGILELCCNEVAPKGVLASLLGQTGEGAKALSGDLPVEVVWKFLRIMEGNSFQVPTDAGVRVELVLLGSRMNHSCLPNALRGPGREKGTVEVRALRDLGEGEEVNVSYIGEALSKPTAPRRAILEARWQFKCLCERCQASDVLRAFRCEVCGGTHLVPGVGTGDSENSVGPCLACGAPGFAVDALERRWDVAFLAAEQDLGRAGRAVTAALEAKDGAALTAAVKDAFEALAAANRAEENCTLQMSHHLRLRFRKAWIKGRVWSLPSLPN